MQSVTIKLILLNVVMLKVVAPCKESIYSVYNNLMFYLRTFGYKTYRN
jgi:hypothetical protein